ncbi:MAG: chemotaxis protein CheD [Candidatus Omnitrophica bacterium]|nr:chemotaxis protein CheD [Candidatus Omnitrophota bacterium]
MDPKEYNPAEEIHVGMADMKVAQAPIVLTSLGLGSCVGIILYYPRTQIGGLAHIMLPDVALVKNRTNRAKFANTAIPDLLEKLEKMGAERRFVKAKIMGGAHMFGFAKTNKVFNVGVRNVEKVKEVLKDLKIRLVAEDVGGSYGRSLYFYLSTGEVRVRTINHGERII